jgi:hypothetical protein
MGTSRGTARPRVVPAGHPSDEDRPPGHPQFGAVGARHPPRCRLDHVRERVKLPRVRVGPAGQAFVPRLAEPDELAQPSLECPLRGGDELPVPGEPPPLGARQGRGSFLGRQGQGSFLGRQGRGSVLNTKERPRALFSMMPPVKPRRRLFQPWSLMLTFGTEDPRQDVAACAESWPPGPDQCVVWPWRSPC